MVARALEELFLDPTDAHLAKTRGQFDQEVSEHCLNDLDYKLYLVWGADQATDLENIRSTSPPPPPKEWATLEKAHPKHAELLIAGLESSEIPFRRYALDLAAPPLQDPRKWDASGVAILIHELRRLERPVPQWSQEKFRQVLPPDYQPPPDVFDEILGRLAKIGLGRVSNVWQPKYLGRFGERKRTRLNSDADIHWTTGVKHFPGESFLCAEEWLTENKMTDSYGHDTEIKDYCGERWVKTDEAAPHPDMDAVAAALKKLEAKEPKQ